MTHKLQLSINGREWHDLMRFPAGQQPHIRRLIEEINHDTQIRTVDQDGEIVATWNREDGWTEDKEKAHA